MKQKNDAVLSHWFALSFGQCAPERAFLCPFLFRELYWIVDDGSSPRAIPVLSENVKAQIAQIWAIPSSVLLPASLKSDFPTGKSKGREEEETAAKRRCQEGIHFDFANVTNPGQNVRQWLMSRERTPIFIAETHLGQEDREKTLQWMNARGLGAMGAPAAESAKGGANEGPVPAAFAFSFCP